MIERARTIAARLLAPVLLLTLALPLPRLGFAAPASSEPVGVGEASVDEALAEGDLTRAREQAVALRKADPSVEHFVLEAEVHTRLGDYASAKRALRGALERVPDGDAVTREQLEIQLDDLIERSRGAVEDEPESIHRERLDSERAERIAALHPPPPTLVPVDAPAPKRVPIVQKWYFWVTLTTIVGSAVAITAIAIEANLDNDDAASRLANPGPGPSAGGLTLRF